MNLKTESNKSKVTFEELNIMINKEILSQVENEVGKITSIELLSLTNNPVYLLKNKGKYVLKFLNDKSSNYNLECKILTDLKYRDYLISPINKDFSLTKYVEGTVLDEISFNQNEIDPNILIHGFDSFIKEISTIPSSGYGALDTTLSGSHTTWKSFLINYMTRQEKKSRNMPSSIINLMKDILAGNSYLLDENESCTIPMDLNLRNFMVTGNKYIYPINMPIIWRGDRLAPYGELSMHIYGTSLWESLNRLKNFNHTEMKKINLYILLMSYTVLVFITNLNKKDLYTAKPWGNENCTFIDIINKTKREL